MMDEKLEEGGSQSRSAVQKLLDEHELRAHSIASYFWSKRSGNANKQGSCPALSTP